MSDELIRRLHAERTELRAVQDNLTRQAADDQRDLSEQETEMITRSIGREKEINSQLELLAEQQRQRAASVDSLAMLGHGSAAASGPVEYRHVSDYLMDMIGAKLHARGEMNLPEQHARYQQFQKRVAAHVTTPDLPGMLPEQIVGPLLTFLDSTRPLAGFFGPKNLTSTTVTRIRVKTHTQVGKQAAEKTELASRKFETEKVSVDTDTLGGYVNLSLQAATFASPDAQQTVIDDLLAEYAIESEASWGAALATASTDSGASITSASDDAAKINAAIWTAAGKAYAAMKGRGRLGILAGVGALGKIGPVFPPLNPTNGYGQGFFAANFGQGGQGSISGGPVVVSAGLPVDFLGVVSSEAFNIFEYRYGILRVTEPSVLGIQIATAGEVAALTANAGGIQKITFK